MIRAVIVDDEAPARERLRRLLGDLPEVEIVGEAEDGEQAIDRLLETKADLVFLDIQMPGCSGLEVAASLPSPRPHLVFCTAFDQYAVDAFEINAVDYLLKPVNAARLRKPSTGFGRAGPLMTRSIEPCAPILHGDSWPNTAVRITSSPRVTSWRSCPKRASPSC